MALNKVNVGDVAAIAVKKQEAECESGKVTNRNRRRLREKIEGRERGAPIQSSYPVESIHFPLCRFKMVGRAVKIIPAS